MADDNEREFLLKRLESAGLALELRTARVMREWGLGVEEPFHYVDVKTNQRREGDVLVTPQRRPLEDVDVLSVVECKHSATGKPWVGVYSLAHRSPSLTMPELWLSWYSDNVDAAREAITTVVSKGLWDNGGRRCTRLITVDSGDHNPALNAARQALSEAYGVGELRVARDSNGHATTGVGGVLAAVVTTAKLWTCRLGQTGQIEVQKVDHFEVDCEGPEGFPRPVLIMNESYLPTYAALLRGEWD